jgi:hypothetical protein
LRLPSFLSVRDDTVKDRAGKTSRRAAGSKSASQSGKAKIPEGGVDKEGLVADQRLVARCLVGEVGAWEDLYAQCHAPLSVSIEMMLGQGCSDPHLVDEIAARVWYALIDNDGELLAKYDIDRGARLITFLRAVAKDEISRYFRTERRRRRRERTAWEEKPLHHAPDHGQPATVLAEFFSTLTPHERDFCGEVLLCSPADTEADSPPARQERSSASAWQLTHRIHRKLLDFLDFGP